MELSEIQQTHLYQLETQVDEFIHSSLNTKRRQKLRKIGRKANQFYETLYKQYQQEQIKLTYMLTQPECETLDQKLISAHRNYIQIIADILNEIVENQIIKEFIPNTL